MKLHTIDVDAFGVLNQTPLRNIGGGVNVAYGSNGCGKTTLLHFLRGVFCGFDDSRTIGLLPPAGGGVGGGSLQVKWDGDVCRFTRMDETGPTAGLRVTLVRNDLETNHPRFDVQRLRTDLLPLLFTVGASDVHSLDGLVRQASRDGIQLVGLHENPQRLKAAAAHVHKQRVMLLQKDASGLVAELEAKRQQLRAQLSGLTDELRQRFGQWESSRPKRPADDAATWEQRVTCLRSDVAAAESDLREAEDRARMRHPLPQSRRRMAAADGASLAHLNPKGREHIDVQRARQLTQLDRRIDHARSLLAEVARARLDVNLRAARIAGSDDTAPGPFLQEVRESLKSLEVGLLDLRDDARLLAAAHRREHCVCDGWQAAAEDAVTDLSREVYRLCEHVSRYELRHRKTIYAGAAATINECELTLLKHLESLRQKRLVLLESSGDLCQWKGTVQALVEHERCECLEHNPRLGWGVPKPATSAPAKRPQPIVTATRPVMKRPSREALERLRGRVVELREELAAAVVKWRDARNWQPQADLPADVRALERQIDETQVELKSLETSLAESRQRWRVLSVAGEVIRRVLERIERDQQPTVMKWASKYLHRLTLGRYVQVCVKPDNHAIEVLAADGSSTSKAELSRGMRDQLALSLRLALVRAYAARGVSFPLVLDDVLVDTDRQRLHAAVSLINEFAREQDQQILYLTCQAHLAEVFELQGIPVRTMPGSSPRTRRVNVESDLPNQAIRGWVDRRAGGEVRPAEPISVDRPNSIPQPLTNLAEPLKVGTEVSDESAERARQGTRNVRLLRPLRRRQPDGPYWLSMDAPIELVPSIGSQMGPRLAGLGVVEVAALIDLDTSELSMRLASLQITPDRLRDWQAEAVLLCCVPDLTGPDAQLLVACGILDANQLAEAHVDRLQERLDELSDDTRMRTCSSARPRREVVQRWIHCSRRARTLRDAQRFSRSGGRRRSASDEGTAGSRRDSGRTPQVRSKLSSRSGYARRTATRTRPESSSQRVIEREAREQQHPGDEAHIAPFVTAAAEATETPNQTEWRFFLGPESLVVDAPSIGPTTAKRLQRIGVLTVADLLNRPAVDIAARLKNRRVNDETVRRWQQQARLMSRIPRLRGHDAQVLVACGICEPEQVAAMTPAALFAIVDPFVATRDGRRLLRSSNTPDLAEVTDWIDWAQNSRHLRAA